MKILLIFILFVSFFFLNASDEKVTAFSGFFDLNLSTYKNEPNLFSIGEFEFDIERSFSNKLSMEAAIVVTGNGETDISVAIIDYKLTNSDFHIVFGKLDIPFGNDTQYYASIDRITVSAPLTTEIILDGGLNDLGLSMYKESDLYKIDAYIMRGSGEGYMVGGRIGLYPIKETLSLGVSYIYDADKEGNKEESYFAFDTDLKIGDFQLRAEYLKESFDNKITGYHITGYYNIKKTTTYLRYDSLRIDNIDLNRLSTGINIKILEAAILKIEYQNFISSDSDEFSGSSFFIQLVITF